MHEYSIVFSKISLQSTLTFTAYTSMRVCFMIFPRFNYLYQDKLLWFGFWRRMKISKRSFSLKGHNIWMQLSIIKHINTNTEHRIITGKNHQTLFSSLVISNYIFLYDKHQLWTQKLQLIFQHWMKLFRLLEIQFLNIRCFYFISNGTFSSTIEYIVYCSLRAIFVSTFVANFFSFYFGWNITFLHFEEY